MDDNLPMTRRKRKPGAPRRRRPVRRPRRRAPRRRSGRTRSATAERREVYAVRGMNVNAPSFQPRMLSLNTPQMATSFSSGFSFRKGSIPDSIIICGRDLGATALAATSAVGAVVPSNFTLTVDASGPTVTRWGTYQGLFNRWRIRKLHVTFVSGTNTTSSGQAFLATENTLATATPTTTESLMRRAGSVMGPLYSNMATVFHSGEQLKWYDTEIGAGSDIGDSPGRVLFQSQGAASAFIPGVLVYDYEIEFAGAT